MDIFCSIWNAASEYLWMIHPVNIALLSKTQQSNMSQPTSEYSAMLFFRLSDVKDLICNCQECKMKVKKIHAIPIREAI